MKLFLFIALLPFNGLLAQKEKTPGYLRVLALGDHPPTLTESREGFMQELAPKEGTIPPRQITVSSGDEEQPMAVKLNTTTKYLELADNKESVEAFAGAEAKGGSWFKSPAPGSPLMALLIRDTSKKRPTWANPISRVIKDDLRAFPSESIRVVNVSKRTIIFRIAENKAVELSPGSVKIFTEADGITVGKNMLLIGFKNGRKRQKIFRNHLELYKGYRIGIYIHSADGNRRNGIPKVRILPEPAVDPRAK